MPQDRSKDSYNFSSLPHPTPCTLPHPPQPTMQLGGTNQPSFASNVGKKPSASYKRPVPDARCGSEQVAPLVDRSLPPTLSRESSRGSKHFPAQKSDTYQWKKHTKSASLLDHPTPRNGIMKLDPPKSKVGGGELGRGRRHYAGKDNAPSSTHYSMLDAVGRRRRRLDANGRQVNRRPAAEESLRETMGYKRKGYTLDRRRNGIPCKASGDKLFRTPTALPGFFTKDNSWGIQKGHILRREPGERPGITPGSNWGFSRATQSTREDQAVFGRDLVSLWRRQRSIPTVIISCCERLEQDFMDTPYMLDALVKHLPPPIDGEDVSSDKATRTRDNISHNVKRKCDTGMTHTIQWDEITDPLVFINLLKIFFSELKSPLCGAHNYERFVDAMRQENQLARISAVRSVVMSLPTANQTILAYIVRFCRRLLDHANHSKGDKKGVGNLLTMDIVSRAFAPLYLRPFGHAIHDEATANSARATTSSATSGGGRRPGSKRATVRNGSEVPESASNTARDGGHGGGGAPQATGESANIFQMLIGSGSREIFQSISLRAYDRPTVKRMSFEEKMKLKALELDKADVDSLAAWEKSTGHSL